MRKYLLYILLFGAISIHAQNSLQINEVCSRNTNVIADEDDSYEDWIEIYNSDSIAIDLSNFYLSDDKDQPLMWQFPKIILQANEHLLIFASGKDRKTSINHWETALFGDSLWRFKNPTDENNSEYDYAYWSESFYDDTEWPLKYGAFGDSTGYDPIITPTDSSLVSIYLRQDFYVSDTSKILSAAIHAYYDDGFTAYLNGYELMRVNMVHDGIKPHHNKSAYRWHTSGIDEGEAPEVFTIDNGLLKNQLKNGKNIFAIENHNKRYHNPQIIKPWLSFGISDTIYQFDTIAENLQTNNIPLHCNFKISGEGEKIYLSDSLEMIIHQFNTPALGINISAGLHPEFHDSIVIYANPSPGVSNTINALKGIIEDSILLHYNSGYYRDSIEVIIQSKLNDFDIRFTTDGSLPDLNSNLYDTAFYLDSTAVIRFRYFSDSLLAGPVSNYTYLLNDSSSFDYFSIITDPYNLWDHHYGIYVKGPDYYYAAPFFEANFWQDWERPVHLQHYSSQGELLWMQDAGVKIHGNYTRMIPQKSFGFYAKSDYGTKQFSHALFPNKTHINSSKRFLLRNGGNDYYRTHFRDLLIHMRMQNENLDIQSGKPVSSYVNGAYWGVYHLREKIDRFYLQSNWGTNPDSINLLEQNGLVIDGDRNSFENLLYYVIENDLSIPSNYQYISNEIDIDNWINNLISNLYHHNTDWPQHNTKFWNSPNYKWRQILVDQDVTMAYLVDNQAHKNSLIKMHDDTISYLAIFYQQLLENTNFKTKYSNRFADLLNTIFLSEEYMVLFDSLVAVLDPEMERHSERWGRNYSLWRNSYLPKVSNFIENRSQYMRAHLREQYDLGENDTITLSVSPESTGQIKLNSIFIKDNNWSGLYFDSIPIRLEAIPNPGFEFVEWQSVTSPQLSDSGRIIENWYLKDHDSITAVFYSESGMGDTLSIAFTEINYHSYANADAGDWFEIYNKENDSIDLSQWSIKGLKPYENWTIPNGVKIGPQERMVFVQDTGLFNNTHPNISNSVGPFVFGLSSSTDYISLWDDLNRQVAIIHYSEDFPWPINNEPAKTIELIDIELDDQMGENWKLGCPGGSPGFPPRDCEVNTDLVFTEINYKSHDDYNTGDWIEILNRTDTILDISRWIFKDSNPNNAFIFPDSVFIESNEKILLIEDTAKYYRFHPREGKAIGSFNFGLSSSGENISLNNKFDQEVIQLSYSSDSPWPEGAAGTGYSIELIYNDLEMSNGENWDKNCFLGTPLHDIGWCIHASSIIISEVKYQSEPDKESGDWIELYNTNKRAVNLNNWKIIHSGDTLNIDSAYMIHPESYITLSADDSLFYQVYDSAVSSISMSYFDLQKNEDALFILDPYLHPGNILSYHYLLDWPVFYKDTNNRTLELINFQNTISPNSWRAGCEFGTPSQDASFCDTEAIWEVNSSNYQVLISPNPTSGLLQIAFYLSSSEEIIISVLDSQSNMLQEINEGVFPSGKHIINLNIQRLPSGIYFLQLRGEKGVDYQKIIKIK